VNRLPRWRAALGILILAGLAFFLVRFAPVYFRNLELQSFVSNVTHSGESQAKPDDLLRTWVLNKARELDLPVSDDDVHIVRGPEGMRIDVRYFVKVDLPGYTVNLHFYPGAGSR
jgi:hypothetical protein